MIKNRLIANHDIISIGLSVIFFPLYLELFAYFFRRHFRLNNGFKILLDECNANLTYLNVYRKNHLKQLTETNKKIEENGEGSCKMPVVLVEEALQAKANCSNLRNDLNFFLKFLSLLDTHEDVTSFYLDETFIEDLTNLALSAQIASMTTCSADLILRHQQLVSGSHSKSTETSTLSENSSKICLDITDKYLDVLHLVDAKLRQVTGIDTLK